jgi:hypothetical protein
MYKITITELEQIAKLLDKVPFLKHLAPKEQELVEAKAKKLSAKIKEKYPAITYKNK